MLPRRRTTGLLLLALALAAVLLVQQRQGEEEPARADRIAGHNVDYFLDDLLVTTMGDDGKPVRTLRASTLRHFEDDDSTELEQPRLRVSEQDQAAWDLQAESGWLSADGELVMLNGEVDIRREASATSQPIHVVTRDLRVQPEKDYAETDAAVSIRSGESKIDGIGMQAWLKHPVRIKLLNQTRGQYVFN